MGGSKKSQSAARAPVARNIRNRTRLHKPRLVTDPAQSTLQLTNQLRALGLYAAPTLGDGNCLFRALADQLWGSPHDHLKLRAEICDWMEARKDRYEGFVDEDRSFDTHIKCMRIPGTYGGHLELSAFSHLKRRNVKVIQPGLVYVIEWSCGWGADPAPPTSQVSASSSVDDDPEDEVGLNERDKRRLRRDRMRQVKERAAAEQEAKRQEEEAEEEERSKAVYVAYHDWEHFSSVRNLAGPHTGLPNVVEKPERPGRSRDETPPPPPATPKSRGKGKTAPAPATPRSKAKGKAPAIIPPSTPPPSVPTALYPDDSLLAPTQIPLPPSRSVSPSAASSSLSQPSAGSTLSSLAPITPPDMTSLPHNGRSPKRTFDESEGTVPPRTTSTSAPRKAKRRKAPRRASDAMDVDVDVDVDIDVDENTPSLSDESSLSDLASPASSSALSSPSPPTPPAEPEPPQRPLTRRQRKILGLPKPRPVPVTVGKTRSAGKIVIPGGRHSLRSATRVKGEDDVPGEWRTNGTGRLDVRGFRELRI